MSAHHQFRVTGVGWRTHAAALAGRLGFISSCPSGNKLIITDGHHQSPSRLLTYLIQGFESFNYNSESHAHLSGMMVAWHGMKRNRLYSILAAAARRCQRKWKWPSQLLEVATHRCGWVDDDRQPSLRFPDRSRWISASASDMNQCSA